MMNVMAPVLLSVLLLLLVLLLLMMRRRSVMVLVFTFAVAVVIAAVADRTFLFFALTTRLLVDLFDSSQFLLQLHASILEPNLDLAFRQAQGVGDLDPPPPCQVMIKMKFFLQFQSLVARVSLATSPSRAAIGSCILKRKEKMSCWPHK